jgi:hypothetical protein
MTSHGRINPRMDERIIIAIVKQADFAVQPKNLKTNKELLEWFMKLKPGTKLHDAIYDVETGEIFKEKGAVLTKYDLYSIPKKIKHEYRDLKQKKVVDDTTVYGLQSFLKIFRVRDKGKGAFEVSRKDTHPFTEENVDDINDIFVKGLDKDFPGFDKLLKEPMFRYSAPDDLKEGVRKVIIKPYGLNMPWVLNNFDDVYDVKYNPLNHWFEEKKEQYSEYDGDANIPVSVKRKDGSGFTKDDYKIIKKWLSGLNRDMGEALGGANVELHTNEEGLKELTEDELGVHFVR